MSENTRTWSEYQERIFQWGKKPNGHLMVTAGAGCGKTTTIVELYRRLPVTAPKLFMAFNVKIKDELSLRGVPAMTMNGFGNIAVKKAFPNAKMDPEKLRKLCKAINVPWKRVGLVGRIVDLMKAYLFPREVKLRDIETIVSDFDLTEDKVEESLLQNIHQVFNISLNDVNSYDFADQICFPIYHNLPVSKYDFIIIDEAQDMAPAKLELVSRAVGRHFICVGDPYQAIYGFAGADSESMNKIREQFDPLVLSLPVTYRCGKKIVEAARKYAPPDFQAGSNNHEGEVANISMEDFSKTVAPKDFVLCRTSAPLVNGCFRLIKKGTRAQIVGKDIGKKLVDLVDKITQQFILPVENGSEMDQWCVRYSKYSYFELGKLRAAEKDAQADNLQDQLECLWCFTEGAQSINDMKLKIANIFDDTINPDAIIFSTIHKAKGLEAERVFCLPSKQRPTKKEKQKREENNLQYVMITRAKNYLYFVGA